MQIISVVRNFDFYNRCVKENPFNKGAKFTTVDNLSENRSIALRYNEFLDAYDYAKPDWLIFCHEDWEIKENWQSRLDELDKNKLYAPIGLFLTKSFLPKLKGEIICSDKDGENAELFGEKVVTGTEVGTFDCQCLLIHSDLVKKYNLRFDKNLSFDLYVEDFCINAKEKHQIVSCIFQLDCQHYSRGNIQPRFYEQLKYLRKKYYWAKGIYGTTVNGEFIGRLFNIVRFMSICFRFLYQNKITKSGKHIIKICKIPVFSKKIV